jgi:hypothetical protein
VKNKEIGSWKIGNHIFWAIIDYGFPINDAQVNGDKTRILQFLI